MKSMALVLVCLVLSACTVLEPKYDDTWTLDSPTFDEKAVLGQAGLLWAQQDTFYTSIWTIGGGPLKRQQEYHLKKQHELWVRRQVELKAMSVEEAYTRIRDYDPSGDY